MANEAKRVDLTIAQIRTLHFALEKYIRNHAVITDNERFDMRELRLFFLDLSRHCDLCESLRQILDEHDKDD